MAEITSAIDFLRKIRTEDFVNVKFTKQDGSISKIEKYNERFIHSEKRQY
jgi:hypothetical protein